MSNGSRDFYFLPLLMLHTKMLIRKKRHIPHLERGEVPIWMTHGRTVLIMKDPQKGSEVSNYRPIKCLPLFWKLFTGLLSDEIYSYLELRQLLPSEQKGFRRNSRGTKDQMLIDKMVMKKFKRRKTSLK